MVTFDVRKYLELNYTFFYKHWFVLFQINVIFDASIQR